MGYKISKDSVKTSYDGIIIFQSETNICGVNINGAMYKGVYALDDKILLLKIPGFTNGTVELHQFKYKK